MELEKNLSIAGEKITRNGEIKGVACFSHRLCFSIPNSEHKHEAFTQNVNQKNKMDDANN